MTALTLATIVALIATPMGYALAVFRTRARMRGDLAAAYRGNQKAMEALADGLQERDRRINVLERQVSGIFDALELMLRDGI